MKVWIALTVYHDGDMHLPIVGIGKSQDEALNDLKKNLADQVIFEDSLEEGQDLQTVKDEFIADFFDGIPPIDFNEREI